MNIPNRTDLVIANILRDLMCDTKMRAYRSSYDVELLREVGKAFADKGYFAQLDKSYNRQPHCLSVCALDYMHGFEDQTLDGLEG